MSEHSSGIRVRVNLLIFGVGRGAIVGSCVQAVGRPASLTDVPFVEVSYLRGNAGSAAPDCLCGWGHHPQGCVWKLVAWASGRGRRFAVNFHVFAKRTRVSVWLVAASYFTVVRFITGVDVRMLLPVAAIGKFPVTAIKLAFKRLLSWK